MSAADQAGPRPAAFPGVQTFRGATLEEVLPRVREELGRDAVVLAQRDGIVGGIAGFFGRRCVEIDAAAAAFADALPFPSLPASVAAAAYSGVDVYDSGPSQRGYDDDLWEEPTPADELALAAEPEFAGILAGLEEDVPAQQEDAPAPPLRVPMLEQDAPEIEPAVWEELTVRHTLAASGFRRRSIESIVALALEHTRPLAPELALAAVVRSAIAGSLETPRGWTGKRKTIVLAGVEGSATSEVATGLAASYAGAGKRVALVGLAGPRAAVSLAMGTDDVDVSLGICDEPDDVPRVLSRLGEAQLLIAVAPPFGDRASAERLGGMVGALGRVETHLVLPAATPSEEAIRTHRILASATRVHCLLPTGIDAARAIGGTLALALEAPLAVRWTTDLEIGGRPTPADASHLARRVLP